MKELLTSLKWIFGQSRYFIPSLSLIVVFGAALSICSVSMAIASKNLIDAAVEMNRDKAILTAIIFAAIILTQLGLRAAVSFLSVRTLEGISNSMRQKLFTCLSKTCWTDFTKYHSDDILTRMTSDVQTIANGIVNVLPSIISLVVLLAAAFTTLLLYDPILAFLAFIIGPASVLLSRFFGRRLKHLHIKTQESESASRAFIHESIQNMLIVKAFCLEKRSISRIDRLQNEKLCWTLRRNNINIAANTILALGYWLGYFLAFGWGALRLSEGAVTFGTLTAFLQLVNQVQTPFTGLATALPQVMSSVASAGRLIEFERLQVEDNDSIISKWNAVGIQFEDVSFAYEKGKPILIKMSTQILSGEIVALMGDSGEGKTTIVRLLLSLIHPYNGHIYFSNHKNEKLEVCTASRSLIAYVPQGNTLFSGTISENLRVGCAEATDSELAAAANIACAWEFIKDLPDGLNTIIGERGLGLSEGQAQRIAIARALLRKTPILVLDEATSALDVNTEISILNAIYKTRPARTCIIITHRTTTLKICSRIFNLVDGKILEYYNNQLNVNPASEAI